MIRKLIFLNILILLPFAGLKAQNASSARVNSTATIVEPIEIIKNVDLHFGNVISGYSAGTVVLAPDGSRTAVGVELSAANPGEVSAAEAIVYHGDYSYSITFPDNFRLFNENNPNQFLMIDQFQVSPVAQESGSDILKIGATLNLQANQLPGFYTNATGFNITVTYN
ncbi:MAG: DUF4402 domain-containing protein [Christiangramia sp.]|uniref:DUF4402 domain-containing protein n=1 Tax=Christiangramia sp. TaxID=1931228 RepID=UPI003241C65C